MRSTWTRSTWWPTIPAVPSRERLVCSVRAEDLVAIEPWLRRLTVPTLVVWGTGDVFVDVLWAYRLEDTIPGVTEVVELDNARVCGWCFFPR